jgi:uncharacterized RDD family membrane protein YckC
VYCPKCLAEYRDGFTECSDCLVALIAEKPQAQKESSTVPRWERPSKKSRYVSALIDLVVWYAIVFLVWRIIKELAYARLGKPISPGRNPFDDVTVFSLGFSVLCANMYLAISNGAGHSVGKALTGLRLVVFVGPYPARPGFARGLVRSALQSNLGLAGFMVATDLHDAFAGTTIVQESKSDAAYLNSPHAPRLAAWKIAAAVVLHLFFGALDTLLFFV